MASGKYLLTDLKRHVQKHVDLFVCSASFEARCRSIADHIDATQVAKVLIAENQNHRRLHSDHPMYLRDRFGQKAAPVRLDTSKPLITADSLGSAFVETAKPGQDVLIDITTFTHEAVLILFRLAREILADCRVQYAYATASDYSTKDPPKRKWLSKGVTEVRSVLGYPGMHLPSRRLHLIVLVGFEHERVAELIRRYEPSAISLGYAESRAPDAMGHHEAAYYGLQTLKAMYGDAGVFKFPCYDSVGTCRAIIDELERVGPDFNVVIAPMNTKVSTVGAALAAIKNESIQLCYAQAVVYNYLHYSLPGEFCYIFE